MWQRCADVFSPPHIDMSRSTDMRIHTYLWEMACTYNFACAELSMRTHTQTPAYPNTTHERPYGVKKFDHEKIVWIHLCIHTCAHVDTCMHAVTPVWILWPHPSDGSMLRNQRFWPLHRRQLHTGVRIFIHTHTHTHIYSMHQYMGPGTHMHTLT